MGHIPTDDLLNRRRFLSDSGRLLVMLSSFTTLVCACTGEKKEEKILADLVLEENKLVLDLKDNRFRALNTIGNGLKLEITRNEKPLLVTRVSKTQVAAFSSLCSHAGYEVMAPEHGVLVCASGHGGSFDLEGRVLTGPPRSNLHSYPTQLIDNRVLISLFL
ncbi:QcrA and Rieske domain-containing protein [Thiovibrio frasassiensis]|uniref:Rieske (2Fe-2S) protein n=1 Tax=Thiovibrio frasassiensis TaxID=2984131 RepID=A0A9X4MI41_9BACT|nr:Rieske (2Fe-2S) protein [Thiovibrio frasassiensis]MDG4476640.1 Rieske (2Fe-2S) protein [Thiovibrio frasassiensis]